MPNYSNEAEYYNDLEGLKEDIIEFGMLYSENYSKDVSKAFNTILNFVMTEQDRLAKEIRKNIRR